MAQTYIFCPWCKGITYPGICSNCGRNTVANATVEPCQQPNGQMNQQGNLQTQSTQSPIYAKTESKKGSKAAIWVLSICACLSVLLVSVLLIGGLVFVIFYSNPKMMAQNIHEYSDIYNVVPSSFWTDVEEETEDYFGEKEDYSVVGREKEHEILNTGFNFDGFDGVTFYHDVNESFFFSSDISNYSGTGHNDANDHDFSNDSCFALTRDCIDKNTSYQLSRECITYNNLEANHEKDNSCVVYYSISGGSVPNVDSLNASIKEYATKRLEKYLTANPKPTMFIDFCDCYVTYNDEKVISLFFTSQFIDEDGSYTYEVGSLNIDVVNGVIINMDEIIRIDADLANLFRKDSELQNSNYEELSHITDEELLSILQNDKMSFVLFSPMGLEIGCNVDYIYTNQTASGWFTVTLIDYEDLLADNRFYLAQNTQLLNSPAMGYQWSDPFTDKDENGNDTSEESSDNAEASDGPEASDSTEDNGDQEDGGDNANSNNQQPPTSTPEPDIEDGNKQKL